MKLKKLDKEPKCTRATKHGFTVLGKEDNGETVSRCGNCFASKYELDGNVRYEVVDPIPRHNIHVRYKPRPKRR